MWVECCLGLQQILSSLDSRFLLLVPYIEGLQNKQLFEHTKISCIYTYGGPAALILQGVQQNTNKAVVSC